MWGSIRTHHWLSAAVFVLGQEGDRHYIVTELTGGGDVEGVIEKAPEHKLTLERELRHRDILET